MNTPKLRILITRLSHIGDCVLTLPLVRALKNLCPNCHISWAMESPTGKLLGDHPDIDQVIPIPKGYLTKPAEILRLRKELMSKDFDLSIDPQSLTKSSFLGWLSGAKVRIGMGGKWRKELSGWLNNIHVETKHTHLVDRTLDLLNGIAQSDIDFGFFSEREVSPYAYTLIHWKSERNFAGAWRKSTSKDVKHTDQSAMFPTGFPEFSIPTSDEDRQWSRQTLKDAKLSGQEFGIINPGASWASKRWENDSYAEVANQLLKQRGFRWLVTWAGDEEKEMAEEIVRKAPSACILSPPSSLKQWSQLAKDATVFLGCDTGPMHMAAACQCRCVVLFGPTKSENSGPYGHGHASIMQQYQEGGAKERRRASNDAMRLIQPVEVAEACIRILDDTSSDRNLTNRSAA